jgi:hypothetical protein
VRVAISASLCWMPSKLADRPAELLALGRVADGVVECGLRECRPRWQRRERAERVGRVRPRGAASSQMRARSASRRGPRAARRRPSVTAAPAERPRGTRKSAVPSALSPARPPHRRRAPFVTHRFGRAASQRPPSRALRIASSSPSAIIGRTRCSRSSPAAISPSQRRAVRTAEPRDQVGGRALCATSSATAGSPHASSSSAAT